MGQEQKDLLLKDLCARLPYGVKVQFSYIITSPAILKGINKDLIECDIAVCEVEDVKPYLRPILNMTKEEEKEFDQLIELELKAIDDEIDPTQATAFEVDFYNKHHFDWRGLIPLDLAIDATNLNIY